MCLYFQVCCDRCKSSFCCCQTVVIVMIYCACTSQIKSINQSINQSILGYSPDLWRRHTRVVNQGTFMGVTGIYRTGKWQTGNWRTGIWRTGKWRTRKCRSTPIQCHITLEKSHKLQIRAVRDHIPPPRRIWSGSGVRNLTGTSLSTDTPVIKFSWKSVHSRRRYKPKCWKNAISRNVASKNSWIRIRRQIHLLLA